MKNFNIENVMNGKASAEEVKALLAQIFEKNENVIKKEVSLSVEEQVRMEITKNIETFYGKDRVIESDDKKFVLIDTGKKNYYEWTITVKEINEKDMSKYSEISEKINGDCRNLPTDILKEKIFKNIPFKYFTYSTLPKYSTRVSDNEMFRMLIESDLIENLEVSDRYCYTNKKDSVISIKVSFDLPLLIKNEVTALKASNYTKWIEYLQYRKNNYTSKLSRSSVKDFVLDAVFEKEDKK